MCTRLLLPLACCVASAAATGLEAADSFIPYPIVWTGGSGSDLFAMPQASKTP